MILNDKGEHMIQHHTHYQEIDGYDEIVWMTKSEHLKLHYKLRREGKCNIPPKELAKISAYAHYRSPRSRENKEKNRLWMREYQKEYREKNREKLNQYSKEYRKETTRKAREDNKIWLEEYQKREEKKRIKNE